MPPTVPDRTLPTCYRSAGCPRAESGEREAPLPSKGFCSNPPYSDASPKYGAAPVACRWPDKNGLGALVVVDPGTTWKSEDISRLACPHRIL